MTISINFNTSTHAELTEWLNQFRLPRNEVTVFWALMAALDFIKERKLHYALRNLEDARDFATPRLRAMKKSVKEHILYANNHTLQQQTGYVLEHLALFQKAVCK